MTDGMINIKEVSCFSGVSPSLVQVCEVELALFSPLQVCRFFSHHNR